MWKDTIDRQINKWNFDFAQLCPLQGRYEWSNESDDSQHQMPEFYKLTARIKSTGLKPSPKQLKKNASASSSRSPSLTPSSSTSSLSESPVKFDMILRGGKTKTPNASPMRSSPKRQRCSRRSNQDKHSPSKATGLIITYSENRKDTLRSAVMSGDCSTASATRQIFKQQSLLGKSSRPSHQALCAIDNLSIPSLFSFKTCSSSANDAHRPPTTSNRPPRHSTKSNRRPPSPPPRPPPSPHRRPATPTSALFICLSPSPSVNRNRPHQWNHVRFVQHSHDVYEKLNYENLNFCFCFLLFNLSFSPSSVFVLLALKPRGGPGFEHRVRVCV
jgi:hypothetical protein